MPAIETDGLSKVYRLGATIGPGNLREAVAAKLRGLVGRRPVSSRAPDWHWALKDVSFTVEHGELLGVIGRNGAGKTTLLKILSRIVEPSQGEARLHGRVRSLLEVGTGFHPELTGRENVFLNGAVLGMRRREVARKFDAIVAFAGVEKFLDTPVKRYSSGMYVRLAFSVAAHLEPEILLVDEVLAVGDAEFQRKCIGEMDRVAHGGRTVVVVSHSMNTIHQLCTRCLLLSEGRVVADGPTEEVVSRYLSDARGDTPAEVHFSPPEERLHALTWARVRRPGGGTLDTPLEVGQAFTVEMRVRMLSVLSEGYGVIIVRNARSEIVWLSDNRDAPDSCSLAEAGERTLRAEFPGILTPGEYYVTVALAQEPHGSVDSHADALSFTVVDVRGRRPDRAGHIQLPISWREVDTD